MEIERDADFRGYWLHGAKEANDYCKENAFGVEDAIFISDKTLQELDGFRERHERRRNTRYNVHSTT